MVAWVVAWPRYIVETVWECDLEDRQNDAEMADGSVRRGDCLHIGVLRNANQAICLKPSSGRARGVSLWDHSEPLSALLSVMALMLCGQVGGDGCSRCLAISPGLKSTAVSTTAALNRPVALNSTASDCMYVWQVSNTYMD